MTTAPGALEPTPARPLAAGKYRPLLVVGEGGMGTVEVALEREGSEFERVVALKRLLPSVAKSQKNVEMFLREAKLAALLKHPNVVQAYDFGQDGGELYLAMEYVEGEPLQRLVREAFAKEGGISPTLVAYVLAEVCDGLDAAHRLCGVDGAKLNLVHRDVSPHNVMIAYEGHVKLLDFGVAKIDDDRGVTKTGEVKGKAAYMSPEQAMGDPLDFRSDLYAVGVVLYECITGKRMWSGTDMEVLRCLALEEPPRLADAAPGAPPRLCELHARLVARDKEARPTSARAVAEVLRAIAATASPPPDTEALRALMQRLFAADASSRAADLANALRGVVSQTRAAEIRASLTPRAGLSPEAPAADTRASRSARSARARLVALVAASSLAGAALATAVALGGRGARDASAERAAPPSGAGAATAVEPPAATAAEPPKAPSAATMPSAGAATPPANRPRVPAPVGTAKARPDKPAVAASAPPSAPPLPSASASSAAPHAPSDVDFNAVP